MVAEPPCGIIKSTYSVPRCSRWPEEPAGNGSWEHMGSPWSSEGLPDIVVLSKDLGWAHLVIPRPLPQQYKRAQVFRNLDEVPRWVSFFYPVITSRGWVEKGYLIIKMMMLKIDNDNAHIYWALSVCQRLS